MIKIEQSWKEILKNEFEMKYMDDIPAAVSINEAIELVKTYDDPKMRTFVNGVLHGTKTELEAAAQ